MPNPSTIKITQQSTHREAPKWSMGGRQSDEERAASRRMPRSESCPGPGKYGVPSLKGTSNSGSQPTFSFGGGAIQKSKTTYPNGKPKEGGIPGPGNYGLPPDPKAFVPAYGFGNADRLGIDSGKSSKSRVDKSGDYPTPGPGTYKMKTSLDERGYTLAGKRDAGKQNRKVEGPGPYPGPGAHKPSYKQCWHTDPMWGMSLGNRLGLDSGLSTKSRVPRKPEDSQPPGPGQYPLLPELGGNIVIKTSPAYSFRSRVKPVPSDSTPGHYGDYSQFT